MCFSVAVGALSWAIAAVLNIMAKRVRTYCFIMFYAERQGSGATHRCTVYLCSEQKRLHSDRLWVVDWNPLFASFLIDHFHSLGCHLVIEEASDSRDKLGRG